MRLIISLLWFIGLISLSSLSTALPATARLFGPDSYAQDDWGLALGGGWRFHFTTPPAMFFPVEPAAQSLNHLYELAKTTANTIRTSPDSINQYSDATSFRVGRFALVFQGKFSANLGREWRARISWPAIATFCEKMQDYVRRGEVLYYHGVIQGPSGMEGAIFVELQLV